MNLKNRSKGNRKAQRKRRKERLKNKPPKSRYKVQLIDGNFTYYPVAYCKYHQAFMTEGLMTTHRCVKRKCKRLIHGDLFTKSCW